MLVIDDTKIGEHFDVQSKEYSNFQILATDMPNYICVKEWNPCNIILSFMYNLEQKYDLPSGDNLLSFGKTSGKVYSIKSQFSIEDDKFLEPVKFKELIDNVVKTNPDIKRCYDERFKNNFSFGIDLLQQVVDRKKNSPK